MVDAARVGGSVTSYKHALSLIGQYLNQQHARMATVAEVDNGFMIFFFPAGQYQKQRTLTLPHADLLELNGAFASAARGRKGGILNGGTTHDKKHPLFPHGYDTFLRALGSKLDHRQAICLTICEAADRVYVDYWVDRATFVIREQRRQAVSNHTSETFNAASVIKLVDLVRGGTAQETQRHLGALRINPHDHISAMSAAFILEEEGNYGEAERFFTRIVSRVPDHPEAHYHVARHAYIRGDKGAALNEIRKALKIRDDLAPIHDLHARILWQHGKRKEAIAAFEQAINLDPDNLLQHYHLAKVYEAMGRKEEAAQAMSYVSRQQAAPAWDMLEEQMEAETPEIPRPSPRTEHIDDMPAASALLPPISTAGDSPASSALLPRLPSEEPGELQPFPSEWGVPIMAGTAGSQAMEPQPIEQLQPAAMASPPQHTGVDPATQWPQQPVPVAPGAWPQPAAPRLTGFPTEPSDANWFAPPPASQSDLPAAPTTLEQRLQPGSHPAPGTLPDPTPPFIATPQSPVQSGALPTIEQGGWPASQFTPPANEVYQPQAMAAQPLLTRVPLSPDPTPTSAPAPSADLNMNSASPEIADAPDPPTPARAPAPSVSAENAPNAVELAAEIMVIQRAIEAEPNRADLHRKLGFLLARQGRTAEAATEFRKALQCSRTNL